jgi:hypothetical protein
MKLFAELIKSEPSVGDVHVATALGNQSPQRRRYRPFSAFVSGGPKKPSDGPSTFGPMPVITATTKQTPKPPNQKYRRFNDMITGPADVRASPTLGVTPTRTATSKKRPRSFDDLFDIVHQYGKRFSIEQKLRRLEGRNPGVLARVTKETDTLSAAPLVGLKNRALYPFDAGTYHVPFPTRPAALGMLRPDQVPRFLDAVTHPKRLPKTAVDLGALTAIKDRVTDESTRKHLARLARGEPPKPAVVARMAGSDHVADGHDRLAAGWLNGDDHAVVRYADLDPFSEEKLARRRHAFKPVHLRPGFPRRVEAGPGAEVPLGDHAPEEGRQGDRPPELAAGDPGPG